MLPPTLPPLLILILSIISPILTSQPHRPSRVQRTTTPSSSSSPQLNQCNYGGGSINNSTVIELGNCFNDFYFIGLNIGTGPQYFNFQFDTGSPTLWIPLGSNPSGFNQTQSSTYQPTNQQQNITYADNTGVTGTLGSDMISVSGTLIKVNGSILFATNSTVSFYNTSVYGLVGMDYPSYPNFIDVAYADGQVTTPVFALDLNGQNQTSYMYYNGGLSQKVVSQTYWIGLYGSGHWQVEIIGFAAGDNDMTSNAGDTAVIDSGTSLLVLNLDLYNAIIQQYFSTPECFIDSNGFTNCYCSPSWPTLSFMFIGVQVFIPGPAYQTPSVNGFCKVSIQSLTTVGQLIILGDVFFREYIVSFDRVNAKVGFYGNTAPVYVFDPAYFVIMQYGVCGAVFVLAIVGIVMWLRDRVRMERKAERDLGAELIVY